MVASTGINEQLLEASCELKRQMWTHGCVFSAAHQKRAPCLRGVHPCWWRPKPTVGKLSLAPCATLLPYSWPCVSVDGG